MQCLCLYSTNANDKNKIEAKSANAVMFLQSILLVVLMIGCLGGKFNFLRIQVTSLG